MLLQLSSQHKWKALAMVTHKIKTFAQLLHIFSAMNGLGEFDVKADADVNWLL